MHRQSLGSPAPVVAAGNDPRFCDDGDGKSEKPPRPSPAPEKTIHLIPCVVLLCFLVLFLASHDPSRAGNAPPPLLVGKSRVLSTVVELNLPAFFIMLGADLVEAGAGAASARFSIIQGTMLRPCCVFLDRFWLTSLSAQVRQRGG